MPGGAASAAPRAEAPKPAAAPSKAASGPPAEDGEIDWDEILGSERDEDAELAVKPAAAELPTLPGSGGGRAYAPSAVPGSASTPRERTRAERQARRSAGNRRADAQFQTFVAMADDSSTAGGLLLFGLVTHLAYYVTLAYLIYDQTAELPESVDRGAMWGAYAGGVALRLFVFVPLAGLSVIVSGLLLRFDPGPAFSKMFGYGGLFTALTTIGLWIRFSSNLGLGLAVAVGLIGVLLAIPVFWLLFPLRFLKFIGNCAISLLVYVVGSFIVILFVVLVVPHGGGFAVVVASGNFAEGYDELAYASFTPLEELVVGDERVYGDPEKPWERAERIRKRDEEVRERRERERRALERRERERLEALRPPETAAEAVEALASGQASTKKKRAAIALLEDERQRAMLTEDDRQSLVRSLASIAGDETLNYADSALGLLIEVSPAEAAGELVRRTRDPDNVADVQHFVERLMEVAPDRAAPIMIARLDAERSAERLEAAAWLSEQRIESAIEPIVGLIRDDHSDVTELLIAFGSPAEPHVWPLLRHQNQWVREQAMHVLEAVGTERSIEHIEPLIARAEDELALRAFDLAEKLDTDAHDAADKAYLLLRVGREEDLPRALELLTRMETGDERREQIAPYLVNALFEHPEAKMHMAIGQALRRWRTDQTMEELYARIDQRTDSEIHRKAALRALGEIGDPASVEPVFRWIAIESDIVAEALIGIGLAAESKTIGALSSGNDDAIIAACRVLKEVGGRDSMRSLYRIAVQHRDPKITRLAREAHAAAKERWEAAREGQH